MPIKPKRACNKPGCPNLTTGRYCEKHQAEEKKQRAEANRCYDRYLRDKQLEAFYKSIAWIRTREFVLNKYNHIDLYDYYINNKVTKANTVHHIIELKVSTHAPARGATTSQFCLVRESWMFQPTPPHGGRPNGASEVVLTEGVSTHAPARGATT